MFSLFLTQFVDGVVPDAVENLLRSVAWHTGLAWGPCTQHQYWFQSPKVHFFQFLVMNFFVAALLHHISRGFRRRAMIRVAAVSHQYSLKSSLNTTLSNVLLLCVGINMYAKIQRPHPIVQLGWLLMPCHVMSLAWAMLLRRQDRIRYPECCYVATLLLDWSWALLGPFLHPDWSDHPFAVERHAWMLQHLLLLALPVYFAARYHTVPMHWKHACHLTWIPIFINFGIYTPCALLSGLNLNYMLFPPLRGPKELRSVWYRPAAIPLFVLSSLLTHKLVRQFSSFIRTLLNYRR